jgi:hypothetical protein
MMRRGTAAGISESPDRRDGKVAAELRARADGDEPGSPDYEADDRQRTERGQAMNIKRFLQWGGIAAGVVLVAFGITAMVMGANGRSTVRGNLAQEQIYFGDAATDPTVPKQYSKHLVDTGAEARAFAKMMRGHTLEATKSLTYAQMGRFLARPGTPVKLTDGQGGTNDPKLALTDPKTGPISNPARNIWVTETALTTALNTAYMAEQISTFGIVVGVALLLSGIGFVVLALGGALREFRLPKLQRSGTVTTAAGGPVA